MRTLILAGSFKEAVAYARGNGLRYYRYAASARTVEGFRAERIVELPGYSTRPDRHALNAIAKRARRAGAEWVQDEFVPEPIEPTVAEQAASADWLFATAGAVRLGELSTDDLTEIGASEEEVKLLTTELTAEQRAEIDRVNAEKDAKYDAIVAISDLGEDEPDSAILLENKGSGRDSESVPPATKPKRKGRRTKEQLAYDGALESWENNGGSLEAVVEAREALAERHPDDERLAVAIPGDPRDADDPFEG